MSSEQFITPVRVVGIAGSLREESYTRAAVITALVGAAEMGASTQLIDLRDYDLMFVNGKVDERTAPPDVMRLRQEVKAASGLILGTPDYHGSYSGVLKNALDLMGFDEFDGKIVGLVSAAGGRMGGSNPLNHLRDVGRALHAWVIPEQVAVTEAWRQFNSTGQPQDKHIEKALKHVGKQVARFAYLHTSEPTQMALREWESRPIQLEVNQGAG
jgi:NAD(P)H-dependent FMN reductase